MHGVMAGQPKPVEYDVVIVGSGAGGGMAAYALTKAGARVCVLEAGGPWDNRTDSAMLTRTFQSPRRGGGTKARPFGEFDGCIGGWELDGEPYTRAPGTQFDWWRARMVGGRTNHWGRISLRFGPKDFRRKSLDGLGDDWPISYADVKPWYDDVDRLIGIFGSMEGIENEPDGIFMPPPKPRGYELMAARAARKLGVPVIPSRLSIITKPLNGRAACHYCGQCNRGCSVNANFSSTNVLLEPAAKTGRMDLRTHAMVREVLTGPDGKATGVVYVNAQTGAEERVRAKVVVLAASACESARILLNSRSSRWPQGLANSSGTLGKYLTDTTGTDVGGFIPKLLDTPNHNSDGVGGMHIYMPWWLDNSKLDFPRGYHIETWGGRGEPGAGTLGGIQGYPGQEGGYGASLKATYRQYYGATVGFSGRGEMIPNDKSYCELDPNVVDRFGIPVLRFHWHWTDYETNQVKHMQETFRAIIREMGGTPWGEMPKKEQGYGIAAGGRIIHELGGTRMGASASSSVTNGWGQSHDVPNLFVADGGVFVSQADKNPTWTILALAMRQADYIVRQRTAGQL
jgi:choline dehydrogenase-like flavoprotein